MNTGYTDNLYLKLGGNPGTAGGAKVLGSTENVAVEMIANGARALRLEPNVTSPNVIGGHSGNGVTGGVHGATIGGGGRNGNPNQVTGLFGTVAGGIQNTAGQHATVGGGYGDTAGGEYSTVGGGYQDNAAGYASVVAGGYSNKASGLYASVGGGYNGTASNSGATVGGGQINIASGTAATVGGGSNNTASGNSATVGGGFYNIADNSFAVIPGGYYNYAGGAYSLAAGFRAHANHQGAFVWGDSTTADVASTANNQFVARAAGGVTLYSSGDLSRGVRLNPDSGSWESFGAAADNNTGWRLGGNAGTSPGTHYIGTADNNALEFKVNGARALRLEPAILPNVIGGDSWNSVTAGVYGATIGGGGGGQYGTPNRVRSPFGTVGGGAGNLADNSYATIGGGQLNTASGSIATVGGGASNYASGAYATVPGGFLNGASGIVSFAAGFQAHARHQGSFVWGDSTDAEVSSSAIDQFTVRASGGVRFFSDDLLTTGVMLAAGGGSWSSVSDRNLKENISSVDVRDVLEKVAAMPVATWNLKTQGPSVRHMGPMAQDFHAAFGLNDGETTINTVDADGVSLAAIQGLYKVVREQAALLAAQSEEIRALKARISAIGMAAGPPAGGSEEGAAR